MDLNFSLNNNLATLYGCNINVTISIFDMIELLHTHSVSLVSSVYILYTVYIAGAWLWGGKFLWNWQFHHHLHFNVHVHMLNDIWPLINQIKISQSIKKLYFTLQISHLYTALHVHILYEYLLRVSLLCLYLFTCAWNTPEELILKSISRVGVVIVGLTLQYSFKLYDKETLFTQRHNEQ